MKYLLWHLGLGDAIICCGLVNVLSRDQSIIVPAYFHNRESVEWMFKDNLNVVVDPVESEDQMFENSRRWNQIRLGYYSGEKFDSRCFDKEFYRHAGVDFDSRWKDFGVKSGKSIIKVPIAKYIFVHRDLKRGFNIPKDKVESADLYDSYFPGGYETKNIFDYIPVLRNAEEIHCINSSFLNLVESLDHIKGRLFFHKYARDSDSCPILRKPWTVLE